MPEKKPLISFNRDTGFIKLIAAASMLSDHIGKIFLKDAAALQIIGRISFPIFAYCISLGAVRTKNIKKYMLRLLVFAIISQPIYILAFLPHWNSFGPFFLTCLKSKNILFSLLAGLIAIYAIRGKNWPLAAAAALFAAFGGVEYGVYGFTLILGFYIFRENIYTSLAFTAVLIFAQFLLKNNLELFGSTIGMNGFGLLSIPFIYIETNTNIRVNKYFFYIFYPAHFLLLYLMQVL